jgi:hypothetical protein
MRIRHKKSGNVGNSNMFYQNDEKKIIVAMYISDSTNFVKDDDVENYDVYLEGNGWCDLRESFNLGLVIPDMYKNYFRESENKFEEERGYYE